MSRFKSGLSKQIWDGEAIKGLAPDLVRRAMIKMTMVEAATDIRILSKPLSNHLEKLSGNRAGQWSIRVNDKYRICFNWIDGRAENIEFVDYH